jgi:hypothetical protein
VCDAHIDSNEMKPLRSVSAIEHNVPGCIISITIPSAEVVRLHGEGTIVDINLRSFFTKLLPKPQTQDTVADNLLLLPGDPNALETTKGPVFSKPLVTNRYDNIIDQLERKYYCGSVIKSNDDEESGSEESESPPVANDVPAKSSKGKKRPVCTDDYDMDDPFIDDEEMIYEVEAAIKTNRTKTKHDGFFVSSGKLEVMSPKKMQKISASAKAVPAKAPSAVTIAPPPAQQLAATEEGKEPAPPAAAAGETKEVKKRKRRTKKELEEAALLKEAKKAAAAASLSPATIAARAATPHLTALSNLSTAFSAPAAASAPGGSADGITAAEAPEGAGPAKSPEEVAASASAPKVKPEKDTWQPNEAVLGAVQEFSEYVVGTGIKLAKSSNIPKLLDEALQKVDSAVLTHISADVLGRTVGYYEALQSAMGGEIPTGKIRSAMARLRLRGRAEKTLEGIEDEIRRLMGDLKGSLAPCPEKLQPSFKAAKKEKAQAQGKAGEVAGGSPPAGVIGAGEVGTQEGGTNLTDLRAESAPQGGEAATEVVITQADASSAPATGKAASGGDPPALTRYEWVCNWTRPMKIALCQIEQNLKLWVVQENQYREKLTVHDKKYMEEADVSAHARTVC